MKQEQGYGAVIVMMMLALASLSIAALMEYTISNTRTIHATKKRSQSYYDAEAGVGQALSWLRHNSQSLVTPFSKEEFYNLFERTTSSAGTNEGSIFEVPTRVKIRGTSKSAVLTNSTALGSAAFPATMNLLTNASFDAAAQFSAAFSTNKMLIRITVVDVLPKVQSKDFGDPALGNPLPETDFYPVLRIDSMVADNRGSHVFATVVGDSIQTYELGFYGQQSLEFRQSCDSYASAVGPYSSTTQAANCPVGSNGTAQIHGGETIYGSLETNGSIDLASPYGGSICADFGLGCPNPGNVCEGLDCGVPLLPMYSDWNSLCPSAQHALVINADTTLSIIDSTPADADVPAADRCWDKITINSNKTLTLNSTNSAYFIETLEFKNNSNSVMNIAPAAAGGKVTLYVKKIVGNAFNGNQSLNSTGNPTQFEIIYLGTDALTLNGTADMNVAIIAPNAMVDLQGNFQFNGALLAQQLAVTGSGDTHYDESLAAGTGILDVQFRMREVIQVYK